MEIQCIFILVLGYVTFCYGQEASVVLPSRCAAVTCVQPTCPNPVIRPGECCPICFEDCSVRFCGVDPVGCEKVFPPGRCCRVCKPIEKPGTCPQLNPLGHCAELCSSDQGCPGIQKCCSVGCGHDCMNPISTPTQPDCSYVTCPPLRRNCRRRRVTPPGQCCPICPGY